ncbi:DnaB-like helicase C-terminal domain-containing protein [Actinomadura opuntiae]|uniref:DnaB-like helicase C-terminal domain-containing protein n=1 Tax=Actinomadura sp. OS1-43 TaxID=604315 RepID=UPI00255A9415|nr:DnaB-like helicase C-terminal domain-containing protein [Actinomadura sp. OS1-43]MDL4813137.1 DnaB-like helicase C-terminal domain-containing protein [Actinomadura sp. OS1-43]
MRYLDTVLDGSSADLADWLVPRLDTAELAALRTSFLTLPGVESLSGPVAALLERGGRFHAVLGGNPEQTDPGALRLLSAVTADFGETATIHLATPSVGWQNAKTYYSRDRNGRAAAYIGSANLTRGGWDRNHEAGLVLDSDIDDKDTLQRVLDGVLAWAEHPHGLLVTPEVVASFVRQSRRSSIGRARRPGPADPTWFVSDSMLDCLETIEAIGSCGGVGIGVPTGFADLDALTGGLRPGTLTVIGARPALGKSTLLLDLLRFAAIKHKIPAALFSLEMPTVELEMRILSAEARVALHAMRSGTMNDSDWTRLAGKMQQVAESPLMINDTGALSIGALCDEATRLAHDYDARLIAVDYLQLIEPDFPGETRESEVNEIIRRIKALARTLNVPIVVTAQLNRGPEQRTDKIPILADLRESDAIAHAADLVILLHREDAYFRDSPRAGEADLLLAKHRQGPTATITVAFQGHYSRFVDMAWPSPAVPADEKEEETEEED